MRWPWQRKRSSDLSIVSWSGGTLAYVSAQAQAGGPMVVRHMGVEQRGTDSLEEFSRRLQALGLKGRKVHAMLRPSQYQLLQIDAPPVPPEELRSAARFQIRELVNAHLDDITLDVMRVGDGVQKGPNLLFVVAVTNAVVREVLDLGDSLQWETRVIDIQETAQRNLQSAAARADGSLDRADAVLVISDERQAVLTISCNEELFYTRRLDLPEGFMAMNWDLSAHAVPEPEGFMPVEEYVPDYVVGGAAYGNDYTSPSAKSAPAPTPASADSERAQRVLVEVQRSLDLWDRSWSSLPLSGLRVLAGSRSAELARWLSRELGSSVTALDLSPHFAGLEAVAAADLALCQPLLGVLLRTETRAL